MQPTDNENIMPYYELNSGVLIAIYLSISYIFTYIYIQN